MLLSKIICLFIPSSKARKKVRDAVDNALTRKLSCKAALSVIKRNSPCACAETSEGRRFLFDSRDDMILDSMYLYRGYSDGLRASFFNLCEKYYGRRRGIFVEGGAHVGPVSIPAAAHPSVSRVIAFEPYAPNYDMLRVNKILNHVPDDRLEAVNAGLSNRKGMVEFEVPAGNFGAGHAKAAGGGE